MARNSLAIFWLLLSIPAGATTYTVKAGGGGNYTTVGGCAAVVTAGSTCVIYAGTYSETVTPVNNGTSGNPITFSTNPGDTVTVTEFSLSSGSTYIVIEGTSANPMLVPNGIVWADHITHSTFQYITTTGGGCWGGSGWYTSNTPTSYNQFLNSTINNCGGTPAGPAIELEGHYNLFDHINCAYAQACITLSGTYNVIRNCIFGPTSAAVLSGQHSQPVESSIGTGDITGGTQHLLMENNYSYQWRGGNSHGTILNTDENSLGSSQNVGRFWTVQDSGSYSIQIYASQYNYFYNNSFSDTQLDASPKDKEDFTFDESPYTTSNTRSINNILVNMTQVGSEDWCIFADSPYVENHNLCYNAGWSGGWYGPLANSTSNTYDASDILNSNPSFVNPDCTPTAAPSCAASNLQLQAGSPAIGAGSALTTAVGNGTSSTALTVGDSGFFFANSGMPGAYAADYIRIGSSTTVQIASINYSTNVITLATAASWSNGAGIYLYKDSNGNVQLPSGSPNLGAFPNQGSSPSSNAPVQTGPILLGMN
jgi:hypothetical protein